MKKGFTLIELLAVVALLGIIVLVGVPSLIQTNKQAEENEEKDFAETIKAACEAYKAINYDTTDYSIPASKLIEEGYLKETLINPKSEAKVKGESGNIILSNCTYDY